MNLEVWDPLEVDRIHFSMIIPSKLLYDVVWSQFYGFKDIASDLVPFGKIGVFKSKYNLRMTYCPTKKRVIAVMEVGVAKSKIRYFKLSLFPGKCNVGELQKFKEQLAVLLDVFSFDQLYNIANVTYLELAADSRTHEMHTFIPYRRRTAMSGIWHEPDGTKGTIYLGSPRSDLRFRFYDKNRQQLAVNANVQQGTRTRIEVAIRRLRCTAAELTEKLENPFLNLILIDTNVAEQISTDQKWQTFIGLCREVGSAQAMQPFTKHTKRRFRLMLESASAPWWNATEVWKQFPAALAAITA